ncbi:ClpP/crotonase-like domain-containing protein [Exophiala viscosa]|uniref:ClpP/crotonase-like domain-containing protein n=1 Tax=Exophiala viscosa TaxID=2486360 RepID=A0AAN6E1U0_9EURO|nr:ClpP/crotonase-like domain-containing protein [Exophiala viscosa]
MASNVVTLDYRGRIAIVTLNNPKKLNAMTKDGFYQLARSLKEVEKHDEVTITLVTGQGKFFSAGADVSVSRRTGPDVDLTRHGLRETVQNTLFISRTFYSHSKILVTALNGPVVGVAAALVACSDFIYCLPHAYLLTPFSSLGLVSEGASSMMLARRMGWPKANEALIMSKRITADELLACGFVNKIFDIETGNAEHFLAAVLVELDGRLGAHLNDSSMLSIKKLASGSFRRELDAQNVEEVFQNLERQVAGIPQKEFEKLRTGQKRHKL